ncbi:MAG: ATP-binding protein [Verrucomicrobiae bacterium]|nr:ATP-binding protein [Verrucomicrobiae bacterium]
MAAIAATACAAVAIDTAAQLSNLASSTTATITTADQLNALAPNPRQIYAVKLEGTVLWANPGEGRMILQDQTGLTEVELEMSGLTPAPGSRVRLAGACTIAKRAGRAALMPKGPVVDNNGVHGEVEKTGSVYLDAGWHPIQVLWFNREDRLALAVEVEGPRMPRQPVPGNLLFLSHPETSPDAAPRHGLKYECFDAYGETLPQFDGQVPFATGVCGNFDLNVIPRTNRIAVRFSGYFLSPEPGLYTFYLRSDDGSQLFVGKPTIKLDMLGPGKLPEPQRVLPGQPMSAPTELLWAVTEGRVVLVSATRTCHQLELASDIGAARAEITELTPDRATNLLNRYIRVTGVCRSAVTPTGHRVPGKFMIAGTNSIELLEAGPVGAPAPPEGARELRLLRSAVEVHKLKRAEAARGYPVRLGGVVTCVLPEHQAFTVQDPTRGIYVVDMTSAGAGLPEVGEFVEIEGSTDPGLFAPVVNATNISSRGLGRLPDPSEPTWDQLLHGSMDAQYVQLRGIITRAWSNTVVLHTRDGSITAELRPNNFATADLPTLQDALVRMRGCLFASWDYVTHQVKPGEIRIYNADVFVEEPPPDDLFATPSKRPTELLQFDPLAGAFQRVKVHGQIVGKLGELYFMMQGAEGIRFVLRTNVELAPAELVEVVGFPDVVAACAPTLREAVARRIGSAPLPAARKLRTDELLSPGNDATRVRVEAVLVGLSSTAHGHVLELQSGMRTFVARLVPGASPPRNLVRGSKIELTGVYVAGTGARFTAPQVSSFELLVTAPSDITVLARPPWWTLERLLFVVGVLGLGLCMAALWITLLHRKVEQRTAELSVQIQERQRAEHRQWLERERTRIAQDLHDELGSGITEISMLALRASAPDAPAERRLGHLEQIRSRATELVTALDEIVWATNPKHDSLASLVSYFSLYADRFLGAAGVRCRVEHDPSLPDRPVASHARHELFLAFREALNNVVKHASATETTIWFGLVNSALQISVTDNGRGIGPQTNASAGDGLANMRARLERLGGRCEIQGAPGQGTRVLFSLPIGTTDI